MASNGATNAPTHIIKGMEAPDADHCREFNRAQSHQGKSLIKYVRMKNGTWNIWVWRGGIYASFQKGQGMQVHLRIKIEIKSKEMSSKEEKIPVFKSVKELPTQ